MKIILILIIIVYLASKFALEKVVEEIKYRFSHRDVKLRKIDMKYSNTYSIADFHKAKRKLQREGFDGKGIYIFTNEFNRMTYVGQSVNILNRINQHLNGRGNLDVYNDMKKYPFTVRLMKLSDSNFSNLNDFERHYIRINNAFYKGYNKTRGNR